MGDLGLYDLCNIGKTNLNGGPWTFSMDIPMVRIHTSVLLCTLRLGTVSVAVFAW
jgi:hypothetical protein